MSIEHVESRVSRDDLVLSFRTNRAQPRTLGVRFLGHDKNPLSGIDYDLQSVDTDASTLFQVRIDIGSLRLPIYVIEVVGFSGECVTIGPLYTSDDCDYERQFIRKIQRGEDVCLVYMKAAQIIRFFPGKPEYVCGASVVRAYKAIEIGGHDLVADAIVSINECYALLDRCPKDWHPRRNREHLLFSMRCAHWHLFLAENNEEKFRDVLTSIALEAPLVSNLFTPSYPISLSLLMLILYLKKCERDEELSRYSDLAVDIFRSAVADSDPARITLFGELSVSHRATLCCLKGVCGKLDTAETLLEALRMTLRVRGAAADRLVINFQSFGS